jgi:hypothetical protein
VLPHRLRGLEPEKLAALAQSMKETGLINPVTLRPSDAGIGYYLIAGAHRLAAAQSLGWVTIPARILHGLDADHAELAEIDENLIRVDLTTAQRAIHVAARKKVYERLHPETKHGGAPANKAKGGKGGKGKSAKSASLPFAKATAQATGKSKRSVEVDARRGKLTVIADVVGTSLDNGAEIDALAKLSKAEQAKLVERARTGEKVSARTSARGRVAPPNKGHKRCPRCGYEW